MQTRTFLPATLLMLALALMNYPESNSGLESTDEPNPKSGYSTGKVTNTKGNPTAETEFCIDVN